MINYDEFSKIELKVATVKSAEAVEGSEKLLKLLVDDGSGERQIIAGIAKQYEISELTNQQIVIITNLEPRKLMGHESQGMLLASDSEDGPVILVPKRAVKNGSTIK